MSMIRALPLATIVLLGSTASALAETVLITPRLFNVAGDSLVCTLVNVATKPLQVDFVVMSTSGTLMGGSTVTVQPDATFAYTSTVPSSAYCRFTFAAPKSKVRANACVLVGGRCGPTAEAR